MDFSALTPIAAFGGFALGIINLGIIVYKDFIRKPHLRAELVSFSTRYVHAGEYQMQLNIRLFAKDGLITIKEVKLKNEFDFVGDIFSGRNEITFFRGIPLNKLDIKQIEEQSFLKQVKDAFSTISFPMTDLKVQKDEIKSITFMDNIITVRQSDGYDELPLYRWRLEITYNDDVLEIPLQLVPVGEIRGAYSHIGEPSVS